MTISWVFLLFTAMAIAIVVLFRQPRFIVKLPIENEYTVHLDGKGEEIEYRDTYGVYSFDISRKKRTYYLQVLGYAGPDSGKRQLSEQEFQRIIPRIEKYLSTDLWFGFFPMHYQVEIVGDNVWPA